MINLIQSRNIGNSYCHCEGVKRPSQSHYSLSLRANASQSHNINEFATSHFSKAPLNDMPTLRKEFSYLQIPCPIVEGDSFVRNQNFEEVKMPYGNRHYELEKIVYLADIIAHSNNEVQLTETLYILNSMIDNGVKGIDKMYPTLSRLNNTTSPNVQTFLAGIYRKTQVPDAFGPLVKMLIQNSLKPQTSNFDPNEEIGGAILAYLNPRFREVDA